MRKKQQLWSTAAPAHGVQVLAPAKEDEPGFAARSSDSLKSVHAQASHPVKAQPGCKHLYALFFGISSQSKPAYDFPLTRKALRGHAEFSAARFVKTKDNGRLFFGAFVDDYQTGEKLVRLVRSKLQHAKPQLLCHKPKVVAELRVDLSTGASLGWAKARRSP